MYMSKGELKPFENKEALKKVWDKLTPQEKREQPVFEKGEEIYIKGAPFRIESIGSHLMTLRPLPRKAIKAASEEGKEER